MGMDIRRSKEGCAYTVTASSCISYMKCRILTLNVAIKYMHTMKSTKLQCTISNSRNLVV